MVALPEALIHDTERLAEKVLELAAPEGVDAVVTVLRDHVKRLDRQRRLAELNAISREFRTLLRAAPNSSREIQEQMYDEFGLPI